MTPGGDGDTTSTVDIRYRKSTIMDVRFNGSGNDDCYRDNDDY